MENDVISGRYRFCLFGEVGAGEVVVEFACVKKGKVGGTEHCWWVGGPKCCHI
jgi:hypothetical protein